MCGPLGVSVTRLTINQDYGSASYRSNLFVGGTTYLLRLSDTVALDGTSLLW